MQDGQKSASLGARLYPLEVANLFPFAGAAPSMESAFGLAPARDSGRFSFRFHSQPQPHASQESEKGLDFRISATR